MKYIMYFSDCLIPLVVFVVVGYGVMMKKDVYDDFIKGATDGFHTVIKIMPTLIGLMVGVGILRASGFLDFVTKYVSIITDKISFPSQLVPLAIVRMFSSSAATGLALDLYKEFGTDSFVGLVASIMLGCTDNSVI